MLNKQASAFLAMGELYDLPELKSTAERKMLNQLDPENMVEMISIAEFFRADGLFEAAVKLTKANMTWLHSQVPH